MKYFTNRTAVGGVNNVAAVMTKLCYSYSSDDACLSR